MVVTMQLLVCKWWYNNFRLTLLPMFHCKQGMKDIVCVYLYPTIIIDLQAGKIMRGEEHPYL